MQGWFDKVKILLHIDQIICQNNHQNTVFVSGALYKYGGDQSYWLLAVVAIARKAILCDIGFLR